MRIPYRPLSEQQYVELLKNNPVILTSGSGLKEINIFRKRQRGQQLRHGNGFISNIITKYGPKLLPLLRKYIFPAVKQFGKDVVNDVVTSDTPLRKSIKKRGLQSLGNITKKVVTGRGITRRKKLRASRKKKISTIGRGALKMRKKGGKKKRHKNIKKSIRGGMRKLSKFKVKNKKRALKSTIKTGRCKGLKKKIEKYVQRTYSPFNLSDV